MNALAVGASYQSMGRRRERRPPPRDRLTATAALHTVSPMHTQRKRGIRLAILRAATAAWLVAGLLLASAGIGHGGEVKVEKVTCLGLANCLRLTNGDVEVVVTTDIGPRIIRYGFVQGENILAEIPGKPGANEWQLWGGHRLWIAPEGKPRSYGPDNTPIAHHSNGTGALRLEQPVEPGTGIQKEIIVTLDASGSGVTVTHKLTNRNAKPFELAAWGLTIMNPGGTAIVPQEPYKSHDDEVLPARPLVLWHYTDLSDPRFAIGSKFVRLSTDASRQSPQKFGVGNRVGWAAYARNGLVFIKRTAFDGNATYPDFGSSMEFYTSANFIEVESLGPLRTLKPGESVDHTERWALFKDVTVGKSEAEVEAALGPLLAKSK